MKLETLFTLENAGWPALLVTDSGVIQRANFSAVNLFGPIAEGKASLAASIWARENASGPDSFLAQSEKSATTTFAIKFRLKEGAVHSFQTLICSVPKESQKLFLLQLISGPSDPAGTPTPPGLKGASAGDPQSVDAGLAHKQKLDCALQLTRTVALDFNNALTSILGHTSLILSKSEPGHPWRASLMAVEKSAEKAAEIAADLAAFSRQEKDSGSHAAGNINDLVRRCVAMFQTPANQNVLWGMQLEAKLYSAVFDEAKLQQALIKIMENAMQALEDGGRVILRTRNFDFKDPQQDGHVRLAPGRYICVEVEDSGCGIPADLLPRIFEPFYSTKDRKKHRGLGLAWVYGIITNHGGSVAVTSEPGVGTRMRVYLPALKRLVKDQGTGTDDLSGTQTILMIDDEDLLLTMGETVLSSYGYRVLTANTGTRALEIFSNAPDRIDLVITDMVMPQMGGREVIERLRELSPGIRVICTSGYVRALSAEDEDNYLQKPFSSQDLLRKVKSVLDSERGT